MTDVAPAASENTDAVTNDELVDELRSWLEENWDPDLTVADWWQRLGLAGWCAPNLPTNAYGKGVSRNDAVRIASKFPAAQYGSIEVRPIKEGGCA